MSVSAESPRLELDRVVYHLPSPTDNYYHVYAFFRDVKEDRFYKTSAENWYKLYGNWDWRRLGASEEDRRAAELIAVSESEPFRSVVNREQNGEPSDW